MNRFPMVAVSVVYLTLGSFAQQGPTPRDIFWTAVSVITVDSNPARPGGSPALPSKPGFSGASGYGNPPRKISDQRPALGFRYALLKVEPQGLAEVLPTTIFHTRDRVKVSILTTQPGYLYFFHKGLGSNNWQSLFPNGKDSPESNRVEAGRIYQMPGGKSFQFNDPAGDEHLFILLSRRPVADLDREIFNLEVANAPIAEAKAVSAAPSNEVSDVVVRRTRDLSLEDDASQEVNQASTGEDAMYVVRQVSGGDVSQVFADVVLLHK